MPKIPEVSYIIADTVSGMSATDPDDQFHCDECGHGWNCIDESERPRDECPNCGNDKTPNVEFSGGAPLHGAASAGTQGYASGGEE